MSKSVPLEELVSDFLTDAVRKTGKTEFHYMEAEPYVRKHRPSWNPTGWSIDGGLRRIFRNLMKDGCVQRTKRGYFEFIKTKNTEVSVDKLLQEYEASRFCKIDEKVSNEFKSEENIAVNTETELTVCETAILLFVRSKSRPVLTGEIGGMLIDQGYFKDIETRTANILGQIAAVIMRNDVRFVETPDGFMENTALRKNEDDLVEITQRLQSNIEGMSYNTLQ